VQLDKTDAPVQQPILDFIWLSNCSSRQVQPGKGLLRRKNANSNGPKKKKKPGNEAERDENGKPKTDVDCVSNAAIEEYQQGLSQMQ
jgi:hypothetical protein